MIRAGKSAPFTGPLASILVLAMGAAFIGILYAPIWLRPHAFGPIDNDLFLSWQLVVNDALQHGQILQWNPYVKGGVPGLADPQSGALSPFNLIALFGMSPIVQAKVELLFHFVLCALGFRLLCQRLQIPGAFGLAGFCVWSGNGFLVFRILNGQTTFYPLLLLPLLLGLAWPRSETPRNEVVQSPSSAGPAWRTDWPSPRALLAGLLTVGLLILEDGVYVYIYFFLLLTLWSIPICWARRNPSHLLLILFWSAAPLALFAFRVLPMAELLHAHPRYTESIDFLTLRMGYDALFSTNQLSLYGGHSYTPAPPHRIWAAYGGYTGIFPFLIAAAAVRRWQRPALEGFGLVIVAGVVIMFGSFESWAPWVWIHKLPLFGMVRAPYRFVTVLIAGVSVLSIVGSFEIGMWITARSNRRSGRFYATIWLVISTLAVAVPLITTLRPVLSRYILDRQPAANTIDRSRAFSYVRETRKQRYSGIANHIGAVNKGSQLHPDADFSPDSPMVQFVEGRGLAKLDSEPNELLLHIDAGSDSLVVLHQNYSPNWSLRAGKLLSAPENHDGLLALRVPPAAQMIRLRYRSRSFHLGLAISALAWLSLAILEWHDRRQRMIAS